MHLKDEFKLILFFLIFFVALGYFIYQSQQQYKEENDEIVKIRINYLYLIGFLPQLFLVIILILGSVILFINSNYLIASIFLFVTFVFFIPILNGLNHFLLEVKRGVYYDRVNDVLIIQDSNQRIIVKLNDNSSKLKDYMLKRTVRRITNLDKIEVSDQNNMITISCIRSFPFDFYDKYKIDKIQTNKLLIWV